MSACPPIAPEKRTSPEVAKGPQQDLRLPALHPLHPLGEVGLAQKPTSTLLPCDGRNIRGYL